jgi:hypothetical protein
MSYSFITGYKIDNTRSGISEKGCDRAPVESPISKTNRIREIYNKTKLSFSFPSFNPFPLESREPKTASRMKEILDGYHVKEKSVSEWILEFEKRIGSNRTEATYIVGSATAYVAGQPMLYKGLDSFLQKIKDKNVEHEILLKKCSSKILKKVFTYNDVDVRIKVDENYCLEELRARIQDFRTDLFHGNVLIVYIGEEDKNSLDLVIYKKLKPDSASNLDDLKINIRKSTSENIVFESSNAWKWWEGHVLDILDDYTMDCYRSLPRFLWQVSKGYTCNLPNLQTLNILKEPPLNIPREQTLLNGWIKEIFEKINRSKFVPQKNAEAPLKNALQIQFEKHQKSHDRQVPFSGLLLRLETQRLINTYSPTSTEIMKEAANTDIDPSTPSFLKAIFNLMNSNEMKISEIHEFIETIAALALYEAWKEPFEVKMLMHDGKWMQRIRFRGKGTFGKKDWLVGFNMETSKTFLSKIGKRWEKMRHVIHSLWFDGISQRATSDRYRELLPIPFDPIDIKSKFLSLISPIKKDIPLAQYPILAGLEISKNDDIRILIGVGELVFKYYTHNPVLRDYLCWQVVRKCLRPTGFSYAAELIIKLRQASSEPLEGYPALFSKMVLNQECDSPSLYEACSPFQEGLIPETFWEILAKSKTKVTCITNEMCKLDLEPEFFFEIMKFLNCKIYTIGEKTLVRLVKEKSHSAPQWIAKFYKRKLDDPESSQLFKQNILRNKNSFSPQWLLEYALSDRFEGSDEEKIYLCKYLLYKPLEIHDKTRLLESLKISEEALWQILVTEYINQDKGDSFAYKGKGISSEDLVMWHEIIENADKKAFVDEKLAKMSNLPSKVKNSIAGYALIKIFKNWNKTKLDISLVKKFAQTKAIPWETILKGADKAEDILKALYTHSLTLTEDKNTLDLKVCLHFYSSLFCLLKPKDEFHTSNWLKLVQKTFPEPKENQPELIKEKTLELLSILARPMMCECFKINQRVNFPLLKRIISEKEGIDFALEILSDPSIEVIQTLIETTVQFDDCGASGAKVFMNFFDTTKHKKIKFTHHLATLAQHIIMDPEGDTEAACRMWTVVKDRIKLDQIPPREQLLRMIQKGFTNWLIDILNHVKNPIELEQVDPNIYCRLLTTVKDLDSRCVILMGCRVENEMIKKKWEIISQEKPIDIFSASKLLKAAQTLKVADLKVQEFALEYLSKCHELDSHVLNYLLEMTARLNATEGYKLWEALKKSGKYKNPDLWMAGFNLINRNPNTVHHTLLSWIINKRPSTQLELLFNLLSKMADFSIDEELGKLLLPFIKKESLKELPIAQTVYWKIDCDNEISSNDLNIIRPTPDQCFKTLLRLLDHCDQQKEIATNLFISVTVVWTEFENLLENEKRNSFFSELKNRVFQLIINSQSVFTDDKKSLILDATWNMIRTDLDKRNLFDSNLQSACNYILDNYTEVSEKWILKIASFKRDVPELKLINLFKILPLLASQSDEEVVECALDLYLKENVSTFIPVRVIYSVNFFPKLKRKFAALLDRNMKTDFGRRIYFAGIFASAEMSQAPTKELAILFIKYVEFLIAEFKLHAHKKEEDEWKFIASKCEPSLDTPISSTVNEIETTHTLIYLFTFINNNFVKSNEKIFFEPAVIDEFLDMLTRNRDELPRLTVSILRMLVRSVDKHFDKEAATKLINFIVNKVSIFSSTESTSLLYITEKDAEFLNELLTLSANLVMNHSPELDNWCEPLGALIMNFNSNHCSGYKFITYGFVSYMLMKGTIHGFTKFSPEIMANAACCAIEKLCNTASEENQRKARQLLFFATPDLLIFYGKPLISANRVFRDSVLKKLTPFNFQECLPQMFIHLSDRELNRDCYQMDSQRLFKFITTWARGSQKSDPVKETERQITIRNEFKLMQLNLILENINSILNLSPHYITWVIDYLNGYILQELADVYRENSLHLGTLFFTLLKGCENLNTIFADGKTHVRLLLTFCTHWYGTDDFIEKLLNSNPEATSLHPMKLVRKYFSELKKCDLKDLLNHKPDLNDELLIGHMWTQTTTRIFQELKTLDEMKEWLLIIKTDFVFYLCTPTEINAPEGLKLNIIGTLELVLKILEKHSAYDSRFTNDWIISFLECLSASLNKEKGSWLTILIVEKIGKNLNKHLKPSLVRLEQFNQQYNFFVGQRPLIHAYYKLISIDCNDDEELVNKALEHCNLLDLQIRHKLGSENIYGNQTIYFEKSHDFIEKFELIFITGFCQLLISLGTNILDAKVQNIPLIACEEFLEGFNRFKNLTTDSMLKLCGSNKQLPKLLYINVNDNLPFLFENRIFDPVLDYLLVIKNILRNSSNDEAGYSEIQSLLIEFSIFRGDDHSVTAHNKYISALVDVYHSETGNQDVSTWEASQKYALKWCVFEKDGELSEYMKKIIKRALESDTFMFTFFTAMEELRHRFLYYKQIRKTYTEWYDFWISRVDAVTNAFRKNLIRNAKVIYRIEGLKK